MVKKQLQVERLGLGEINLAFSVGAVHFGVYDTIDALIDAARKLWMDMPDHQCRINIRLVHKRLPTEFVAIFHGTIRELVHGKPNRR